MIKDYIDCFIDFGNGQEGFIDNNKASIGHYELSVLKNGKQGKKLIYSSILFTPLRTCELCERLSTPRNIYTRNDCWDWSNATHKKKDYENLLETKIGMLCTSCWSKIRHRIINKLDKVSELEKLTNQLINICREIKRHERQNIISK